jgi:hypothetical protein
MDDRTGRAPHPERARLAAAIAGALVVFAGCGFPGAAARLDARFVESVRAEGREVPQGADGEAMLIAAARKVCERRRGHETSKGRREAALTPRELEAVTQAFAGDARSFAALALRTYCD